MILDNIVPSCHHHFKHMDETRTKIARQYDPLTQSSRILATRWQVLSRIMMIPFMAISSRGINIEFEPSEIKPNISYLVASNHQSQLDSFVELSTLNNVLAGKLLPFRAMTYNKVLQGGVLTQYLLGMGCFPSNPHETLPSGIDLATKLLEDGQTVFICPEGRRTLPRATAPRPGVTILANVPNVMILPAHIQWKRSNLFQRTFKFTLGKPFDGSGMTADEIMDKVYALRLP
jgi:1-acyl-sn-glycerol-3-phosphate acyltransferase